MCPTAASVRPLGDKTIVRFGPDLKPDEEKSPLQAIASLTGII